MERILLQDCDEVLEPTIRLSTHITSGKLKILETNPKSEEVANFYPIFWIFVNFPCNIVEQNRYVLLNKF